MLRTLPNKTRLCQTYRGMCCAVTCCAVQLVDFGMSDALTPHGRDLVGYRGGTIAYCAPEVLEGARVSIARDLHSPYGATTHYTHSLHLPRLGPFLVGNVPLTVDC